MKKIIMGLFTLLSVFIITSCKVKTYDVKFNYGNGRSENIEKVYSGNTVNNLEEPVRDGYIFTGWYEDEFEFTKETKVFKDYNLVAKWDNNNSMLFSVTIKYNNGTEDYQFNVTAGNTVNEILAPVKEGYKFIGWFSNNEKFSFDTKITADLILEARYEKSEEVKLYEITLVFNNGLDDYIIKVEENSTLSQIKEPTKEGYVFTGWYLNDVIFLIESNLITTNITLVAKWEEKIVINTYDVIIKYDNGMQDVKLIVDENSKLELLEDPVKPGYTFTGWFVDDIEYDFDQEVVSDLVLEAKYEIIEIDLFYLVTLVFDNGISNFSFRVRENTIINDLTEPSKDGYNFIGWYLNDELFNDKTEIITEDITLVAKWEQIYVEVNYTITFNLNNGLKDIIVIINENDTVSKPLDPIRIGYIFIGWYIDDVEFEFNNQTDRDLIINAHWVKETVKYNVEIILNNGEQNIAYRIVEFDKVVKPKDPIKEGYRFIGWYLEDNLYDFNHEVTSNIKIEAHYQIITSSDKVIRAIQLHKEATNFSVKGAGTINASIVKQKLTYEKTRTNDKIFLFNATYGSAIIFSIKPYIELTGNINNVNLEKGTVKKNLTKESKTSDEAMSYQDYINLYGAGVNDLNYIIDESTIKAIQEVDHNTFKLELDLVSSIIKYKDNISEMNPYDNKKESINFSKIEIIISLNSNGYFSSISYDEIYTIDVDAPFMGWTNQTVTSNITETYEYYN